MRAKNLIQHSLLALLILLPLLGACRNKGKVERPADQVTITFACYEWEETTYRNLADRFEADNPGIRVQLVLLEPMSDLNEIITRADTLIMPVFFPSLAQRVRDLSPFIETDETFQPKDFYPHTLQDLQWDGGVWGLPFEVNFNLVFYDKVVFDVARIPYPEPGWTWDDFMRKAQALTEREGDQVMRWGFAWRLRDPLPFIQGRAGPLVDTSSRPPVPLLDRPEVAQTVRWFTDLALVHQVMPYLGPQQSESTSQADSRSVGSDRAAMWSGSSREWRGQSTGLGVAPFPVDEPASATSPLDLRTYVMSAGTTHPQESWRWLAFLSWQSIGEGLPARRSVAESSGYWSSLDEETATTLHFALEHGLSQIESGWLGPALNDAIEAVLQGEQDVEAALAQAQAAAQVYIASETAAAATTAPIVVPTPAPISDAGASIVFIAPRTYWGKQDAYDALADRFHELHPEITVEVKPADLPTGTSVVTLQLLAAQGDCLDVSAGFLSTDPNALLSLDPFIAGDAAFSLDDFYFLEPFRHEGQLWALPAEGYPRVMFYNKALFDTAGLAYPTPDWTLDDFFTLAVALTKGEGGNKQYGYAPFPGSPDDPLFFIEQQGARLVDGSAEPVIQTFNTSAMAEAIRWYTNLIHVYGVIPELWSYDSEQKFDLWGRLIRENRAAMWSIHPVGTYFSLWTRPDRTRVDVGAVPMPRGPGRISDLDLIGYSISAQTQHPQACWEWLKFLSEQTVIVQGVPARRSVAESVGYRQQVDQELAAVYLSTLEQSDRLFTSAMYLGTEQELFFLGQFLQVLETAVTVDGADVEHALNEAQHRVDEYMLCLETTTGYESEEKLETCAQAQGNEP